MFQLLNQQQQAKRDSGEDRPTDDADEPTPEAAPASLAVPTPSSTSHGTSTSSSFDLSSSPLGLVTSLSSSLLHSAGRRVLVTAKKAREIGRNVRAEVKKGMEKGVEGIERATRHKHEDAGEEEPEEGERKEFEREDDDGHHATRGDKDSWAIGEEAGTAADASSFTRKDWQTSQEEKYPASGDYSDADEDADDRHSRGDSSDDLTGSGLSLLRMNFLRLLQRCEETSFAHLHPTAGTAPLLSSSPPAARTFVRSVELLRAMLGEFRQRRAVVQGGKENGTFVRRVAFLSTLAEKDAAPATRLDRLAIEQKASCLTRRQVPSHPMSRAERQTKALLATASEAARAAESADSTVPSASASSSSAGDSGSFSADGDMPVHLRSRPIVDRGLELRKLLFARAQQQRDGGGPPAAMSREFEQELEQRELVGELHEMTDSLKQNALRLRQALSADAKVLHEVDEKLDGNLHAIGHENSRLKKWAATGCSEMCWNILLIVVLWTVFIFMFLFMKIFPAGK